MNSTVFKAFCRRRAAKGFLLLCLILTIAGCGSVSVQPQSLFVFYATPGSKGAEWLWARHYSAAGNPEEGPIKLGRLGLVAQTQIVTSGPSHQILVTLGHHIVAITRSQQVRPYAQLPAPYDALSIRWLSSALYAVVQTPSASHAQVWRFEKNRWQKVRRSLPQGIVTLVVGPMGMPSAFVVDPHRAYIIGLTAHGPSYPIFSGGAPAGTVGFARGTAIIPYASGQRGFGQWIAHQNARHSMRYSFSGVRRAVLAILPGWPLWGLTVQGLVSYRGTRPQWSKMLPWPSPREATMVVVGQRGTPWLVILDGPSQGIWFNQRTGRFGPSFAIVVPDPAVVRAVALSAP